MVFKNGDQKQDRLIEYVFAPFYVENELENKTLYAAGDIFCSINRRQWWRKKKKIGSMSDLDTWLDLRYM